MAPRFEVLRPCEDGLCPRSSDASCACIDPIVHVDLDELSRDELARFRAFGSDEQQGAILDWLADECPPEELLAGQPDRCPELRA